jgi:hypothetical protein
MACQDTSHVLRLAGTLAYIRWATAGGAEPTEIDVVSLVGAVRVVEDYFWPIAVPLCGALGSAAEKLTLV